MSAGETVLFVILSIISLGAFTASLLHFREKGPLLNNAYIFASDSDRRRMDKGPYYRQSAVVFLILGAVFLSSAADLAAGGDRLFWVRMLLLAAVAVYAAISSAKLGKRD